MFRRRRDDARSETGPEEETSADEGTPEASDDVDDEFEAEAEVEAGLEADAEDGAEPEDEAVDAPSPLAGGPWDVTDDDIAEADRADLGALQVPVIPGFDVQVQVQPTEVDAEGNPVNGVATTVLLAREESALELTAFAAPKTSGLWDEVRAEIEEEVKKNQAAQTREAEGPFGTELHVLIPVEIPEEAKPQLPPEVLEQGYLWQAFRFMGVDGPRWMLRGTIHGAATQDPEQALMLEQAFSQVVVNRGEEPMPPRDVLVLTLPNMPGAPGQEEGTLPPIDPFHRGPEITEVR